MGALNWLLGWVHLNNKVNHEEDQKKFNTLSEHSKRSRVQAVVQTLCNEPEELVERAFKRLRPNTVMDAKLVDNVINFYNDIPPTSPVRSALIQSISIGVNHELAAIDLEFLKRQ